MSPRMKALWLALFVGIFSTLTSRGLVAQTASTQATEQGCWFCGYYSCYIAGGNQGASTCYVNTPGICMFGNICSGGYPLGRSANEQLTPSGTPALVVALGEWHSGLPVVDCKGRVFWSAPTPADRAAAEKVSRQIVL